MRYALVLIGGFLISTPAIASGLTNSQKNGMYRHGNWMWSVEKCDGIQRNKRYWFFLKEGGKFKSFSQITELTNGWYYKRGWNYMQQKAVVIGHRQACDYAMEQWPAMLWRKKAASGLVSQGG